VEEACKILDVPPPKEGKADMTKVMERFKRLFDTNEPKNGGSFYIQSKILRARQRIELEVKAAEEKASKIKEQQEGWKPKVYKD
jgi:import inner membrane translocase subunit TIM16